MSDLEQFIHDDDDGARTGAAVRWSKPVLLLSFEGSLYGVVAERVQNVMPYREPSPVPHGHPALAGILQDRGRMLALVRHPAGAGASRKGGGSPKRVVVCTTSVGRVGLPAAETHSIRTLRLPEPPEHTQILDDPQGAVCFLDVERVAAVIRGAG